MTSLETENDLSDEGAVLMSDSFQTQTTKPSRKQTQLYLVATIHCIHLKSGHNVEEWSQAKGNA